MFDGYEWIEVDGAGKSQNIILLSLSTCGFCKNARAYLNERGAAYRYLDLDTIPKTDKIAIKTEFRERFGRRPAFPSLILDNERFLIGFIRQRWDEEIGYGY